MKRDGIHVDAGRRQCRSHLVKIETFKAANCVAPKSVSICSARLLSFVRLHHLFDYILRLSTLARRMEIKKQQKAISLLSHSFDDVDRKALSGQSKRKKKEIQL